jgi:hypothetical protein
MLRSFALHRPDDGNLCGVRRPDFIRGKLALLDIPAALAELLPLLLTLSDGGLVIGSAAKNGSIP